MSAFVSRFQHSRIRALSEGARTPRKVDPPFPTDVKERKYEQTTAFPEGKKQNCHVGAIKGAFHRQTKVDKPKLALKNIRTSNNSLLEPTGKRLATTKNELVSIGANIFELASSHFRWENCETCYSHFQRCKSPSQIT